MNQQQMQAIWLITEKLREAGQLEAALSAGLEIIAKELACEEGSVWVLNRDDNRLYAVVNVGQTDITGFSIEQGQGIAGSTVQRARSGHLRRNENRPSKSLHSQRVTRAQSCPQRAVGNSTGWVWLPTP